ADLGAEVILIEPPDGSPARRLPPFGPGDDGPESLYFQALNLNKRGMTLDLAHPRDRDRFQDLLTGADFLLESLPGDGLAAYGLSPERLLALNPRLVIVSIPPFGHRGPYAGFVATDLVLSALSGVLFLTGDPDRPPVRVGPPYQSWLNAGGEAAIAA